MYKEAESNYRKAKDIDNDVQSAFNLGNASYNQGKFEGFLKSIISLSEVAVFSKRKKPKAKSKSKAKLLARTNS